MGLLDFLKGPNIDQGVEQYRQTPGAVLLDVRTREEYGQGRIAGSRNLPLHEISQAGEVVPEKSTPLFVYCLSGARGGQAAAQLKRMGYTSVTNIGGIGSFHGKVVR